MLNNDQQRALTRFISFMANDQQDMIISGPAGAGKGYLLQHIEQDFQNIVRKALVLNPGCEPPREQEIHFTATTNEAVGALGIPEAVTIYRLAGIRPYNKKLHTYRAPTQDKYLVFVDEASYIDEEAYTTIRKQLPYSKIVWVMDAFQLAPVGSDKPYLVNLGVPMAELNTIERNQGDLQTFVRDLRQSVKDEAPLEYRSYHNGSSIQVVPARQLETMIRAAFLNGENAKVLGYRNATMAAFNRYIDQTVLGNPPFPYEGAMAEVRSYNEEQNIKVGTKCQIYGFGTPIHVQRHMFGLLNRQDLMTYEVTPVRTSLGNFFIPQEKDVKVLSTDERMLILTQRFAGTVHKAQGRTIDTVFVDGRDIMNSWDANLKRRLMYVAVSRAKQNVVICL